MSGYRDRIDRQHQVAFGVVELADHAVVHPQPVVVPEGVAIRPLHRRAGGRADVREEQWGA